MRRGRTRGRKILTIIIAGIIAIILVVIAIPLYIGYIERKRVTEATSIIGAIITSQKVVGQRTGKYYSASTIAEFMEKGIDITDTKCFTYETTPTSNGGFTVTVIPTDAFGPAGEWIAYIYEPGKGGRWTCSGSTETHPMLYIEPY
jgi:Tfp pilus assembly protein PilE